MNHIKSSIPAWAASQAKSAISASALQKIFNIQAGLIINNNGVFGSAWICESSACAHVAIFSIYIAPVAELFYDTGYPDKIGMILWQLLPFSRGSVSITVCFLLAFHLSPRRASLKETFSVAPWMMHCSHLIRSPSPKRTSITLPSMST